MKRLVSILSLLAILIVALGGCFPATSSPISLDEIPEFNGERSYVEINGNVPFFTDEEMSKTSYAK